MQEDTFRAPELSVDARLQAHWAAQVVSAAGTTLAAAREDFGHTALSWEPEAGWLVGVALPDGRRLALEPASASVRLLDAGGSPAEALELQGQTLASALATAGRWLGADLRRPEHDLPAHAVG